MNGSLGIPYTNGLNSSNKTCLILNEQPSSRSNRGVGGPLNAHLNGKINHAQIPNSFTNGHVNGYEKDYINGMHEHLRSNEEKVSKNPTHLKTFGNGIINGLTKHHHHHNGIVNSSLEIESRNNKNVTFKFDSPLLRNEKGNGINVTVNGKHEADRLKSKVNGKIDGVVKSNTNGEVVDEISTEL